MNKPVLPVSSHQLKLPKADRSIETYRLAASRTFPAKLEGTLNRVAFSAAHVVADPLADVDPWLNAAVDWDKTIAFREHVWDLGLGVAEAMDTAQRGMGLDWPTSLELIQRSVTAAKARGNALVFSGAGTDHLAVEDARTIAFREHIWDLGLGVAEAMDTAQRGMGLDWPTSLELIRRSVAASKARGDALVFSGAGTDHLSVEDAKTLDERTINQNTNIIITARFTDFCEVESERDDYFQGK